MENDKMPRQNVFPTTQNTWIKGKLEQTSHAWMDLTNHVMEVYAHPLRVYLLGTSFRRVGDPDDIINGFFADRLKSKDFLHKWRESGKKLRYWLITAFKFYLYEYVRALKQQKKFKELPDAIPDSSQETLETSMFRAFKVELVRKAVKQAEERCREENLAVHWQIFMLHTYQGLPYAALVDQFGITRERAAVMNRTAEKRFTQAVRDLLCKEGTTAKDIDKEINSLLEV